MRLARWIAVGLLIAFGGWIAVRGREEAGSGAEVPPEARSEPAEPAESGIESPRLRGSPAAGSPRGPSSSPEPPSTAEDAIAGWRLRLKAAEGERALVLLGEIGARGAESAPLIDDLIPLLAHEDERLQLAAAHALVAMGQAAVEPVVAAVRGEFERKGAAGAHGSWAMGWGTYVLGKIGEPAVLPVAELLGHKDAYHWALVAFQRLATPRVSLGPATDVILRRLGEVQEQSPLTFLLAAVPSLGRDAARVVPRLIDLLQDPRNQVRIGVVQALGRIGPDASAALGEMERLLRETTEADATLRRVLKEAIAQIRGER